MSAKTTTPDAAKPKTQLVRSKSGRLIEVPVPEARAARPPVTTRTKVLIGVGACAAVAAVVLVFTSTQGHPGRGSKLEEILRDFGHVIREVRGPGIVR